MIQEYSDSRFNTDDFMSIPSFKGKINYCKEHLGKQLSSGSSRIVWQIDNNRVLKLAKNRKGIAQNEAEYENCQDYYIGHLFAQVFDYDNENFWWIIAEKCRKPTTNDFKKIYGLSYEKFAQLCIKFGNVYKRNYQSLPTPTEEEYDFFMENCPDWYSYITDYQPYSVSEIVRKSNLGVASRPDGDTIVIIDSGFNENVDKQFYSENLIREVVYNVLKKYLK